MTGITQIRGTADLQRALPVVAPAATAPFQTPVVQTAFAVLILQQHAAAPAKARTAGQGFRIRQLHRRAEVQMLRMAVFTHPHQVGNLVIFQQKQVIFAKNHSLHSFSFIVAG